MLKFRITLLLGIALAACDVWSDTTGVLDESETAVGVDVDNLTPGTHPIFVPRPTEGGLLLDLYLVQVGEGPRVASVQGEFMILSRNMRVVDLESPGGVVAAWNEVEEGSVRLAAIAVGGFPAAPVLTIRTKGTTSVQPGDLLFRVEELATHVGFADVTNSSADQPATLISSGPVPSRVSHPK